MTTTGARLLVLAVGAMATITRATPALYAQGVPDSGTTVKVGGFVDGYYAWDFARPRSLDRAYSTQPARHNEFNVNLAYVEAVLSGARVRGRLALQYGTSVQANYAGEPRVGSTSGGTLSRHLQEAVVGVKLTPTLWLDGGIYLSHIGSESWISRDNLTYTRSLTADYSPYYQSGIKLTWQATPRLAAQLNVVNGWQVISESNEDKSVGMRLDFNATPRLTLSTYNLVGNEAPDSLPRQLRLFQGFSARWVTGEHLTFVGNVDLGQQDVGDVRARWYGYALIGQLRVAPAVALVARVERYSDPHQVIIVTGSPSPFRANGGSIGVDVAPAPRALWRTELRALSGRDAVFPGRDRPTTSNAVLVSSLALTF